MDGVCWEGGGGMHRAVCVWCVGVWGGGGGMHHAGRVCSVCGGGGGEGRAKRSAVFIHLIPVLHYWHAANPTPRPPSPSCHLCPQPLSDCGQI